MRFEYLPETAAAFLVGTASAALLGGALLFQYVGGYPPCEMCLWQRWPHGAAIVLGLGGGLALANAKLPRIARGPIPWLAIAAIALSGALGVFHAGVEWAFWEGPASCTGTGFVPGSGAAFAPFRFVRCDEAPWRLFGLSLAGYNALFSFTAAVTGMVLLQRKVEKR